MNKKIKELLKTEGALKINEFCYLEFYEKDCLGENNHGKGFLSANFHCYYWEAWHTVLIESRDPNEIREELQKEQTYFFENLAYRLNQNIKGGRLP